MIKLQAACISTLVAGLCLACTSDDPGVAGTGGNPGGGGTSGGAGSGAGGTAGAAPTGGSSGSGNAGMPSGGSGALGGSGGSAMGGSSAASAGAAGMSGSAGTGGSDAGSSGSTMGGASGDAGSPPVAGMAGQSGAGAGGSGGGSGGSGGSKGATPSAGCGKSGRPSGGVVTVTNDHIYTFPASYDGNQAFPLFMGFHAAGNPIDQIRTLTNGSGIEMNYVRAFGKSAGNEWVYNTDIAKVLRIYDELVGSYCIDTSRVFAAGHSSGAQMIVQILTHPSDADHVKFRAVAPVAASNYGAIPDPMAVMYIQAQLDTVRNSSGADVVARFTTANGCGMPSTPYAGVSGCMSSGVNVNPGCVEYPNCSVPTVWCSHNDPQYSNTFHGWPCFATTAMYDFFQTF